MSFAVPLLRTRHRTRRRIGRHTPSYERPLSAREQLDEIVAATRAATGREVISAALDPETGEVRLELDAGDTSAGDIERRLRQAAACSRVPALRIDVVPGVLRPRDA